MQRSITYKNYITPFYHAVAFFIYTAISGIHLFLPPLLVLLYILFSKALEDKDMLLFSVALFCLMLFESQNEYMIFSTAIYFGFLYRYITPRLEQNLACKICLKAITVFLIYAGFFFFYSMLSALFLLPEPHMNYYTLYYMVVEFLIVSIF